MFPTCNSIESSDHQHKDSGQVEVPPQTHLDKQRSWIQVSLVAEHNVNRTCRDLIWQQMFLVSQYVMYRYLCEDRQQQRKDSQVSPDPLASKTAPQVLWHGHNLHTFDTVTSKEQRWRQFSRVLWGHFPLDLDVIIRKEKMLCGLHLLACSWECCVTPCWGMCEAGNPESFGT